MDDVPGNRCCPDVYSAKSLLTLYSTVLFILPPDHQKVASMDTEVMRERDVPAGEGSSK